MCLLQRGSYCEVSLASSRTQPPKALRAILSKFHAAKRSSARNRHHRSREGDAFNRLRLRELQIGFVLHFRGERRVYKGHSRRGRVAGTQPACEKLALDRLAARLRSVLTGAVDDALDETALVHIAALLEDVTPVP